MQAVSTAHRIYFAVVGLFAIWVGFWGYFVPGQVWRAIPWTIPPLHARFVAAMYLSGAFMMFAGTLARHLYSVRIVTVIAAVWTGMLLVVSLLNLDQFDPALTPVWFWFFAYVVFPVAGAIVAWRHWRASFADAGAAMSQPMRIMLTALGIVCGFVALLLFLFPAMMVEVWPWPVNHLLAQIYSGPFLAFAVAGLMIARAGRLVEIVLAAFGMAIFSALALIASTLHLRLFQPMGLAAALWFAGLAAALALTLWAGLASARSASTESS